MLRKLLARTPIAWLQMSREKMRLVVAVAGIAFADVLMFVQLGFKDALYDSSVRPHYALQADLVIINPQFEMMAAVKSFARERLYQAASVEGVASVSPLYLGRGQWRNPTTRQDRVILVFGIDPAAPTFNLPEVNQRLDQLKLINRVLFDQAGRKEYGEITDLFQHSSALETEMNGSLIRVSGLFKLGASFTADGNVIASDSTFLNLFRERQADQIDVGLIKLKPGANREQVKATLVAHLPSDVKVLTLDSFANREKAYWANVTPIGFVFWLGSIVGFMIGSVIVYQILYSDVSDHLPEYATLKAMGYSDRYLIVILIQESLALAILGFFPGMALSIGIYQVAQTATRLPIIMVTHRAVTVLLLTILMCAASGLIALRKLQTADPADIF